MNRRLLSLFVLGMFVACGSSALFAQEPPPAAPTGPTPHIKFDATEVNLGDVIRGQDAVATFTYHNTGSAPLHIVSAKPG